MIIKKILVCILLFVSNFALASKEATKPNIVIFMADDLGWGDTGFNGSKVAITPELDSMAKDGAILDHFYSIGPVCSPTRAAFLTGRHYYRLGMFYVNKGHLAKEEYNIAKMLKENGYTTGHFGKWHIGTLSKTFSSKGAIRQPEINYAPPWERGFDESFSTETSAASWDIGKRKDYENNPYYHNGVIIKADDNLDGDDSRVIMDRVIPFIEKAVKNNTPFFSAVCFHTPHAPAIAGQEYLDMYPKLKGKEAHYYGAITAMDEQIGRLRKKIKELGQEDNTVIFFFSDNGPGGNGSTGGLKGRKKSLFEGGVRVPAVALYPKNIKAGTFCDTPMSVLDFLPTIASLTNAKINSTHILDGEDVLDIIKGKKTTHSKIIPMRTDYEAGSFASIVKGNFKLIMQSPTDTTKDILIDLSKDRDEKNNLKDTYPEVLSEMRKEMLDFLESAKNSHQGGEYNDLNYKPVTTWQELGGEITDDMLWSNPKKANKKKN